MPAQFRVVRPRPRERSTTHGPESRTSNNKIGLSPLENISNADLGEPVIRAGDAGAPEPHGRTNPCAETLSQPLPHFEFQIQSRFLLLNATLNIYVAVRSCDLLAGVMVLSSRVDSARTP